MSAPLSERDKRLDQALLAALRVGAPWWVAMEAASSTRLDRDQTRSLPTVPDPILTNSPHRAVLEDCGPPWGKALVCEQDNQDWPCDSELQLRQEVPDE